MVSSETLVLPEPQRVTNFSGAKVVCVQKEESGSGDVQSKQQEQRAAPLAKLTR